MNGATFVARAFSGDQKHFISLTQQAINHKGFAFIDTFSPCPTFNKDNTLKFFKDRVKRLEDEDHDTSDWKAACEKAMVWGDTIYTGLFLQTEAPTLDQLEPVLEDRVPMTKRPLALGEEQAKRVIERMM